MMCLLRVFLGVLFLTVAAECQGEEPWAMVEEDAVHERLLRCKWNTEATCPDDDVRFYLYTETHPDSPHLINFAEPINKTEFDSRKPTKVLIHGFMEDHINSRNSEIREAYLREGGYNVIDVDWSPLVKPFCYISAVFNTKHTGKCLAYLLQTLIQQVGAELGNIHLIGFSLGAHVAAVAGNSLRKFDSVGRITGLDPAKPLFALVPDFWNLDTEDASFVDIIHTNAGTLGQYEPSGHVDFYVNGGTIQPDCYKKILWEKSRCSHGMAPKYYALSVDHHTSYWGKNCKNMLNMYLEKCEFEENIVEMGDRTPSTARGIYFVRTTTSQPHTEEEDDDDHAVHE